MSSSSSQGKGKSSSVSSNTGREEDDRSEQRGHDDGVSLRGGRGPDVLIGTEGADSIKGAAGGDTIYGLGGNDDLKGNTGDDVIYGGAGRDEIKGDTGNDLLDGGSGSDRVDAGSGNDVAVYVMSENGGAKDEYDGGSGVDTLRLVFTRDEWMRADVQADVARYLAFLDAHTNPSGQADGHEFEFKAFNLEVEKFEKLEVMVDGQLVDPRDQIADAVADTGSVAEDAALAGNVLANDNVPDLVRSVELVTGPAHGQLTFNADGSYVYLPGPAFDHLAVGQTATESFAYRVTDADGDTDTATVTITITGANDGPVVTSSAQAGAVTEDETLSVSGQVTSSDVDDGATATYSGNATGAYGSFAVDSATGAWVYTLDNPAHQDLTAGESHQEVFAVTVTDDQGATAIQNVTVTVTGTNDAPVITAGETTGAVTEDGAGSASGHLVVLDPDHNATQTWTVVGGTGSANADYQFRADSFTVLRNGTTLFQDGFSDGVAPPSSPAFPGTGGYTGIGANAGALTEADGRLVFDSSAAIPFEGVGTTDPIVGQNAILRTNIDPASPAGLKSTADFSIQAVFDLALPDSPREAYGIRATDRLVGGPGTPPDQLGDDVIELMVMETRGGELRVALREIDFVADQTTLIEAVALNAPAGADQIRLKLDHSTSDVGALHASFEFLSGGVLVGSQAFSQVGRIFGTETPGDTSDDENWTRAEILARAPLHSDSVLSGDYGTLYVTQAGEWTYSLDNTRAATQSLAAGQTVTDVFTVEVADEHGATDSRTVTVTVTGTNDGPVVLTQNTSRALGEDSPTHALTATGLVQFDDVDLADTHTVGAALQSATVSGGSLPAGVAAALAGAMSVTLVDASTGEGHGDFRWDFALADAATQFLAAGQTLTATFQVSVSDGTASAAQTVTLTITGSNDGPIVTTGAQAGAATEDGVLSASGQVTSSDVDDGATASYAGNATGAYGSFAVNAATGEWTYALDNVGHQNLAAGETHQETFTVTLTDDQGATATQDVTITVTGTNDGPVVTSGAQAGAVQEDAVITASGQVTSSDVDNGASATYSGNATGAFGGFVVDAGTGAWTYTLDNAAHQGLAAGESHDEIFTVTVTDDHGATATQDVTVTITGTNDGPVVAAADVTGTATEALAPVGTLGDSGTIAFTDLDLADAHTVGPVTSSPGALGALTAAVTTDTTGSGSGGVVTWNYSVDAASVEYLAAGQTKVESFTFDVSDGQGGSATRTVSVTLTGTNDAPVISGGDAGGAVTAVALAPEAPPQPLTFTVQQFLGFQSNDLDTLRNYATTHGASYTAQTNVIDYTDDPNGFAGELPGSNRWPAAEAQNVNGTGGVNDVFFARITADFSVSTADTYTFRTFNDDGVFLLIDNQLVIADTGYHPEAPFQGSIALAPGNHTIELFFYENGGEASLEFSARNSTGSFGLVGADGGGLGGAVSQVADAGVITFSDVDLSDAHSVSAAPVGVTLGTLTVVENADTTGTGTGGQVTWTYTVSNSAIAYLGEGETRVESFTVTVNDGHGGIATQQVDVTITGTNDAPVISGGASTGAVAEDGASTATGQLIVLDADVNDSHSWTVVGGTSSGDASYQFRADSFTVIRNGATLFQDGFSDGIAPPSAPAFPGTSGYTGIGVTSGALSEAGGRLVLDSSAAIPFEGVGTTDPIVGQNAILRTNIDPANLSTGLKSNANFSIQGVFDLVLPDSPRESYGIRATDRLVGGPGTPPDQPGDDTIELMVRESLTGKLQVALREVDFAADQVTNLQVLDLNPPAGADQIRLRLDHSTSDVGALHASFDFLSGGVVVGSQAFTAVGRIFGTETPGDTSDDENWTRAEILARAPLHDDSVLTGQYGELNVNQAGEWTYTLDNGRAATQALAAGETATDTFTLQVADGHGAGDTQTVTVTVTGANDAPVVLTPSVTRTIGEDGPAHQLAASGLMQFDDVDLADSHSVSASLQSVTVSGGGTLPGDLQAALAGAMSTVLTNPAADGHGDLQWSFALNDAATQFLNAGQTLTAVYEVAVSDGMASGTRTVTVNITGADDNRPPVASGDAYVTGEDMPLTQNVLVNDTDPDAGDTLSVANAGTFATAHGSVTLAANGQFTYTPEADYNGADSFTYAVRDAAGAVSNTATVNLTVNAVNDKPFASNDGATTAEDTAVTIDVLANDTDVEGDVLTVTGVSGVTHGTAQIVGNKIVYTPDANFSGTELFSYTVSDGHGGSDAAGVVVSVTPVNDAPTLVMPASAGGTWTFGSEFRANTTTSSDQLYPDVAVLKDGSYMIAWMSIGQDGSGWGVYAKHYAADGSLLRDEFLLSQTTANDQLYVKLAALDNGGFAAAWSGQGAGGQPYDVIVRTFDAQGNATGAEVMANQYVASTQYLPSITALIGGGFVAVWNSYTQDGSDYGVFAREFDASGAPQGNEFQVNSYASGLQFQDGHLSHGVAGLDDGGFVAVWRSYQQDGSGYGAYGQRYDADGARVGAEFRVNATSAGDQLYPSVAGLSGGGFVVTWSATTPSDGSGYGVFAQRYDAAGQTVGGEFQVNTYAPNTQFFSRAVSLADGGFAIGWVSAGQDGSGYGAYLQRYDASGVKIGGEVALNQYTASDQIYLGLDATANGGLVTTWSSYGQDNSGWGIYARAIQGSGVSGNEDAPIAIQGISVADVDAGAAGLQLTLSAGNGALHVQNVGGGVDASGISGNDTGTVVLTGTAAQINATLAASGGLTYQGAPDFSGSVTLDATVSDLGHTGAGGVLTSTGSVKITVNPVNDRPVAIGDGATTAEDTPITLDVLANDGDVEGDALAVTGVSGLTHGTAQIVGNKIVYTPGANFSGTEAFSYTVSDGHGGSDTAGVVVNVTPVNDAPTLVMPPSAGGAWTLGSEFRANTTVSSDQIYADVAVLKDGSYVIAWTSYGQDGSSYGAYAKHYAADGSLLRDEFLLSQTTAGSQIYVKLAALDNGGFAAAWSGQGPGGQPDDVIVRTFDAQGNATGGEVMANQYVTNPQYMPSIAALEDGAFVVTWNSYGQDGSGYGIFGRKFDASGAPQGNEFQVNTYTANDQFGDSHLVYGVSGLADGGFVAVWRSYAEDGSGQGVFAQRYDASGARAGAEFRVNTTTAGEQLYPSVAGLSGGGFVAAWTANSPSDGSGYAVFAQRYDAAGLALGGEFRVNTYTAGDQLFPHAIGLADGGFAIQWTSSGQDGSGYGAYVQRYDADGTKISGEVGLNQYTASDQSYGGLAPTADGGLVAAWSSYQQDGNGWGIYARAIQGAGLSVNEDTPLAIANIRVTDVDAGGAALQLTLAAGHGALHVLNNVAGGLDASGIAGNDTGTVVLTGTAAQINATLAASAGLTYQGDANFNGAETLNATVTDFGASGAGGPQTSTASLNFTVKPMSDTFVLSNLVVNGSFEPNTSGWTTLGDGVDVVHQSGWQSGDGAYSLDLNAFHPGGVQQVLATTPGAQYTVGFDLSKNPGNTDHATVLVSVDNASGTSQSYTFDAANTATSMQWSQQSFTFVATGTSTTLSFASTYPTDATGEFPVNAQGPALDEVVVVSNKTIDGFTKGAGGDVLQLHDVLASVNAPHDGTAFSGGFVRFLQSGSDTLVQVDADGGGNAYLTLATVTNTLLTQADTANYTL